MGECEIPYIPARLHTGDRAEISTFEVGELIFRRTPQSLANNPFGISLVDISVNRKGLSGMSPLSEGNDVLYNVTPEKYSGEFIDGLITTLVIRSLTEKSTYKFIAKPAKKTLPPNAESSPNRLNQEEINNTVCEMELCHKPTPCNYAHCAFEIKLNGQEVTYENYKSTLGHKKYTEVRDKVRLELVEMMLTEEIEVRIPNDDM